MSSKKVPTRMWRIKKRESTIFSSFFFFFFLLPSLCRRQGLGGRGVAYFPRMLLLFRFGLPPLRACGNGLQAKLPPQNSTDFFLFCCSATILFLFIKPLDLFSRTRNKSLGGCEERRSTRANVFLCCTCPFRFLLGFPLSLPSNENNTHISSILVHLSPFELQKKLTAPNGRSNSCRAVAMLVG